MSSQSMNLTPIDEDYENRMVAFMIDCNDGKGEPMSCHQAGEYFAVVKEDHSKAAGIYKTNCDEKGYGASCFNYGRLLMSGKGVEANDTESEKYFAKGCDQGTGHLVSCYHQAMLMMINSEKDKNIEVELYDAKTITKQKIKIMTKTNLVDLIEDEYSRFPDDPELTSKFNAEKDNLEKRRNELFDQIDHQPDDVKLVMSFFENKELVAQLQGSSSLTIEGIATYGITPEALESYYNYGKLQYECGIYAEAEDMLGNYLSISQPQSTSVLGAKWGRLACRILSAKWDLASQDLAAVKEAIDVRNVAAVDLLRQRAWLLHWALFVNINLREGVDALVDFFNEKYYLTTIENMCPWLLRYYTAFVILSPTKRRTALKDVLNEIQNMSYQYSDPMTEFLTLLYVDFDLANAPKKLLECHSLMKNDFFLQIYADKFLHEARILVCEMYCTIHSKVDFIELSTQFNMTVEESERWFVENVMNTASGFSTDAKIDSATKSAFIAPPVRVAYQHIIDRTRDLTGRSNTLANNLGTLLQEQSGFLKAKLTSY